MGQRITRRPRNLDALHASGVLYGGLGTSKIYVIGLAFAIAGYASFWLMLAVGLLTLLIGINYIVVCKYYTNGGGVYASVRKRSQVISLLGAFFLIADYIITAALSALSAFHYLGVQHPAFFSILAILFIGGLNYWGPRHIGRLAFFLACAAVVVLVTLFLFSLPHVAAGIRNLQPLGPGVWKNWTAFVGVVLTLSGIESVASMTGVMRLDPGSTPARPSVTKTAGKAIWMTILEAVIFTVFFTLVLSAVNGLEFVKGGVIAPDGQDVRDYVFRFLARIFVGGVLGSTIGSYFSYVTSIVLGLLLLSAVNTAINGMIGLFYLMAQDDELPRQFKKLNRYGVPKFPHLIATLLPVVILLVISNLAVLASLYAIGFVGAITMNLAASSTDKTLPMLVRERILLFGSALIMLAIEVTLFIDKPHARVYILAIIALGLILRGLSKEARERKKKQLALEEGVSITPLASLEKVGGILCMASGKGQALSLARERSQQNGVPLTILFVREQRVLSERDLSHTGENDREAVKLFNLVRHELPDQPIHFAYTVTDAPSTTISEIAMKLDVQDLIMDLPRRGVVAQLLRGDVIREILASIPEKIELFVLPAQAQFSD